MPKLYQKKVAEEGWAKACPECGKPLVYRHNRKEKSSLHALGFHQDHLVNTQEVYK